MSSHAGICHKFCNGILNKRTKTVEWNGNRVYCHTDTIYSYGSHFAMGFFGKYKGLKILFVNTYSYSSSTNKHQSQLRQAINPNFQDAVLYCDFADTFKGNSFTFKDWNELKGTKKRSIIKSIIQNDYNTIVSNHKSLFRARRFYNSDIRSYIANDETNIIKVTDLAEKFGFIIKRDTENDFDYKKLEQHINKRAERNKVLNAKAERRALIKDRLKNLRNNILNSALKFKYNHPFTSLRIEDNRIKTSNYNEVTIEHFKKSFAVFLACLKGRKSFQNKEYKLNGYQGLHVKKNGLTTVGCTRFYPDDIFKVAKKLQIV